MKKVLIPLLILCFIIPVAYADDEITSNYLSVFLTNSSGSNEVIGDYTGTNASFFIQPPSNETWHIARMMVTIEDSGNMAAGVYGAASALTNGITLRTNISGVITNLTNGEPIQTNLDWAKFCYDVTYQSFGVGNNYLTVRWTFAKANTIIELDGSTNDRIEIIVNDDFTDLVSHHFLMQGHIKHSGGDTVALTIMIGLAMLGFLILYLHRTIDKTHWLFQIFLMMTIPLIFVMMGSIGLQIGAGEIYENTAKSFYTFGIWFLRIFYTYLFISLIYTVVKAFKTNKGNRGA